MATLSARSTDNVETPLIPEDLEGLRPRLRGPVIQPAEPGYDDARAVWNAMIDRRPAAIVRCMGAADVMTCVDFARERNLLLSIKGGGHNIAGLAVCDGGLMLDLSPMRGVWVDAARRTAIAQGGCLLGDVDRETQIHGLASVMGFVSNTGIAGLTLGGGFGYLTRRFGWTSDNVLSVDVVTADCRLRRASETENPDLFWALRGGGGNFGVVTSFEYKLLPVGPTITGGLIAWRAEEADAVLDMYRRLTEDAPTELACAVAMRLAPPAPWLPREVHGKPIVALVVCDSGPVEEARRRLAPVKGFRSPVGDVVQPRPYTAQQSILDATQPKGRRYYWKSEYLSALTPGLISRCIEHAARILSPHSAVILFPIGGALHQLPEDHSAAGNRDASFVLNITSAWDNPGEDRQNIEWARTAWEDMRVFSTGGTYLNFLNGDEADDRTRAAYGSNYHRLAGLKAEWDPANFFRVNKNIAPRK